MRWLRKKYKRLCGFKKARTCWEGITTRYPDLFVHWRWTRGSWAPGVIRAGSRETVTPGSAGAGR